MTYFVFRCKGCDQTRLFRFGEIPRTENGGFAKEIARSCDRCFIDEIVAEDGETSAFLDTGWRIDDAGRPIEFYIPACLNGP